MGIDIATFRCRVGIFSGGCHYGLNHREKNGIYNPFTNSPDIHYRAFACCILVLIILSCCNQAMMFLHDNTINMNLFQDVCSNFEASPSLRILCRHPGTLTNNIVNYNISRKLLLLSADVESNPGPIELCEIL